MEETIKEVSKLIQDFLGKYNKNGWGNDELFDLDADIVQLILNKEFSEAESGIDPVFIDEEDAILSAECEAAMITGKIRRKWKKSKSTIEKASKIIVQSVVDCIKNEFKV